MEHKQMSMNSDPVELANYLHRHFPESHYVSVYEAGFCGFSVHRDLVKLGIDSKVIHPADVPSSSKERTFKTDK